MTNEMKNTVAELNGSWLFNTRDYAGVANTYEIKIAEIDSLQFVNTCTDRAMVIYYVCEAAKKSGIEYEVTKDAIIIFG